MGVESTYRRFIGLVSQARRIPPQRVHEIAQGRVWDGGTARQLGLVDRFGSLDDAIAEAARRANVGVEDAGVVWLEREPGFWHEFLRGMASGDSEAGANASRDPFARLTQRPELLLSRALADAEALVSGPALQARCLECSFAIPAPRAARAQNGTAVQRLVALFGL
jgi:protease-4